MDSNDSSLAKQIYHARPEDTVDIIAKIQRGNPFSREFMDVYQDFSPLVWAMHKDYNDVAITLIKKLPQSELLNSFILKTFIWNYEAVRKPPASFFCNC